MRNKIIGTFLSLTLCASPLFAASGFWQDRSGLHIGGRTNELIGFFGATPIAKPSSASQTNVVTTSAAQKTIYTYTLTDGQAVTNGTISLTTAVITNVVGSVTNEYTVVTGATLTLASGAVNASLAANTTNTISGFTTTAQADAIVTLINAIRSLLIDFGLWKGGP